VTATVLVAPAELDGVELEIAGEAFHHLFHAARAAAGDAVRVVDGGGRARHAAIERVERRRAVLRLGEAAPPLEPKLRLELLLAPPRPSRASWLVEKGTELGVAAFRFLDCERSARPLDGAALERLRRVARAAVEQCGRSRLPEVTPSQPLEDALAAAAAADVYLLDPRAPSGAGAAAAPRGGSAAVLAGPEGGFTRAEAELAAGLGARPLRLVPALLRTETAALAASAWALLAAEGGGAADSE
jgi:16S rRNA (uracil1498-N3)-methyltransferase